MIILPYADDLRDTNSFVQAVGLKKEDDITKKLNNEEKRAAELLVQNLEIHDFDSRSFENPSI